MTSKEFIGAELEQWYAEILDGKVVGGFNDNGIDVIIDDKDIPAVQVKSSVRIAAKFLAEAERRRKFIPLCIGEPGTRDEILTSLKKFGVWVGYNISCRERTLKVAYGVKLHCAR